MRVAKLAINQGMEVKIYLFLTEKKPGKVKVY